MSSTLIINEASRQHDKTDDTAEVDIIFLLEKKTVEDEDDNDIIFLLEKPAYGDSGLAATITNLFGTTTYVEWQETLRVAHILCSMSDGKFSK